MGAKRATTIAVPMSLKDNKIEKKSILINYVNLIRQQIYVNYLYIIILNQY